jgi:hypothetical protein
VLRTILSLSSASQITRVGVVMESLSRSLAYLRRDVAGYVLSETAESGQAAESAESPARQVVGLRDLPGKLQNANRPEITRLVRLQYADNDRGGSATYSGRASEPESRS